jgi:hypothetical protein
MTEYQHGEAFCLMTYRSDDGTEEERIWNSRDGVTPFIISLLSGKSATHVDWRNDVRAVDYKPKPGERIFTDLTPERALEAATRNIKAWKESGMSGVPSAKELAAQYLTPGAPDLIEVVDG